MAKDSDGSSATAGAAGRQHADSAVSVEAATGADAVADVVFMGRGPLSIEGLFRCLSKEYYDNLRSSTSMNVEVSFGVPPEQSGGDENKEMQMSPTLTKMMSDERIRETTKRATRAALLERPAGHGKRAFARWASTWASTPR
jgi:hypothetical protein